MGVEGPVTAEAEVEGAGEGNGVKAGEEPPQAATSRHRNGVANVFMREVFARKCSEGKRRPAPKSMDDHKGSH